MSEHNDLEAGRGWRIVFVMVHLAFMIMNVLALLSTFGQRALTEAINWEASDEQLQGILFIDRWGASGRLSFLAAGIYLMALIARRDERVPKFYLWYSVAFLSFEVVLNSAQLHLWGIPRGTPWASHGLQLAAYFAAMVAWAAYVWRSKRVRTTFVHAPRAVGPMSRLLIGIGAIPLFTWPLVLNNFVEATVGVAWWINPKDSTAGSGLAEGILLASVVIGLFVLMKNAWRMRNVWIAVLLPVFFAILLVMYTAQGFGLHYRF